MDNILAHSRLTAQAALKAKIEDLAVVSRGLAHDLKNLITPVSTFLVHTKEQFLPGTAEGEVHAAACRSIRTMTEYIREALFFANRFEPKIERVAVSRVFDAVSDVTASHCAKKEIAVRMRGARKIRLDADAVLLQRLVINLVLNAVSASASGRDVIVSVEERAGRVYFEVIDSGCGIPPENLKRIFEPYFSTKEFGEHERGFGLGLTISQKIAELHHGQIRVASELGRGTTVTVELPVTQPAAAPLTPEPVAALACNRHHHETLAH